MNKYKDYATLGNTSVPLITIFDDGKQQYWGKDGNVCTLYVSHNKLNVGAVCNMNKYKDCATLGNITVELPRITNYHYLEGNSNLGNNLLSPYMYQVNTEVYLCD